MDALHADLFLSGPLDQHSLSSPENCCSCSITWPEICEHSAQLGLVGICKRCQFLRWGIKESHTRKSTLEWVVTRALGCNASLRESCEIQDNCDDNAVDVDQQLMEDAYPQYDDDVKLDSFDCHKCQGKDVEDSDVEDSDMAINALLMQLWNLVNHPRPHYIREVCRTDISQGASVLQLCYVNHGGLSRVVFHNSYTRGTCHLRGLHGVPDPGPCLLERVWCLASRACQGGLHSIAVRARGMRDEWLGSGKQLAGLTLDDVD